MALTFLRKLWLVLQGPRLVQVICFLNEDCNASNGEGKQIVANTHVKSRTLALNPSFRNYSFDHCGLSR